MPGYKAIVDELVAAVVAKGYTHVRATCVVSSRHPTAYVTMEWKDAAGVDRRDMLPDHFFEAMDASYREMLTEQLSRLPARSAAARGDLAVELAKLANFARTANMSATIIASIDEATAALA